MNMELFAYVIIVVLMTSFHGGSTRNVLQGLGDKNNRNAMPPSTAQRLERLLSGYVADQPDNQLQNQPASQLRDATRDEIVGLKTFLRSLFAEGQRNQDDAPWMSGKIPLDLEQWTRPISEDVFGEDESTAGFQGFEDDLKAEELLRSLATELERTKGMEGVKGGGNEEEELMTSKRARESHTSFGVRPPMHTLCRMMGLPRCY